MKLVNKILFVFTIFVFAINVTAQDSLYIYKDGVVIDKHELAEVDSVIFYKTEVPEENTLTDIDGNVYNTVVIGTQTWMAENLKATKYNDGIEIPNVAGGTAWGGLTSGAFCWYDNDEVSYKETYGALYNWYAVETDKLCPSGWHLPSHAEWEALENYISGEGNIGEEGNAIKTESGWKDGGNGFDAYGFSAKPNGGRDGNYNPGAFYGVGAHGHWWSSSESSNDEAYDFYLNYDYQGMNHGIYYKSDGFSIRCIKD